MKRKLLKVLIIATTRFELDGITNVILNYFRAMDKSDIVIDFVVPNDVREDLRAELEKYGSNIYKIDQRNKKPILYLKKLIKLIRKNNYDIVHAHGNSCTLALEMYAAKKAYVKVRISHSHNTMCKYKFLHKILRNIFERCYTHAFACGEKAGKWLFNNKPFEIINNGIDIDRYSYNEAIRKEYRNKYNLNGKRVVGHIGHFSYQKNHEFLIRVFSELYKLNKNYHLLLIGDGELKNSIERQVKELGLSDVVTFTGKTLNVPQLMQAMDMIVMPSRFEGLPLTLIEAQAACLPCFVSDKISREVEVTNLIKFISLDASPKEWANLINGIKPINRSKIRESIYKQIVNAGYSINDNARRVKELYIKYSGYN